MKILLHFSGTMVRVSEAHAFDLLAIFRSLYGRNAWLEVEA